jgi:hypothetical protein
MTDPVNSYSPAHLPNSHADAAIVFDWFLNPSNAAASQAIAAVVSSVVTVFLVYLTFRSVRESRTMARAASGS